MLPWHPLDTRQVACFREAPDLAPIAGEQSTNPVFADLATARATVWGVAGSSRGRDVISPGIGARSL
jgi:hypothetical protein